MWKDDMTNRNESAVALLIRAHSGGRSVRRMEADADLPEGSLSNFLKPSTRAKRRMPSMSAMERFAHALDTDLKTVADAFLADAQINEEVRVLTVAQERLIEQIRYLNESEQWFVLRLVEHLFSVRDLSDIPTALDRLGMTPATRQVDEGTDVLT